MSKQFGYLKGQERLVFVTMWLLLGLRPTRGYAIRKVRLWSTLQSRQYTVACFLQARLAQAAGTTVCEYCTWEVEPGELHDFCEDELRWEDPDPDRDWGKLVPVYLTEA